MTTSTSPVVSPRYCPPSSSTFWTSVVVVVVGDAVEVAAGVGEDVSEGCGSLLGSLVGSLLGLGEVGAGVTTVTGLTLIIPDEPSQCPKE